MQDADGIIIFVDIWSSLDTFWSRDGTKWELRGSPKFIFNLMWQMVCCSEPSGKLSMETVWKRARTLHKYLAGDWMKRLSINFLKQQSQLVKINLLLRPTERGATIFSIVKRNEGTEFLWLWCNWCYVNASHWLRYYTDNHNCQSRRPMFPIHCEHKRIARSLARWILLQEPICPWR